MSIHSPNHISFLRAFQKHHVKFLLIGGHAAIYYGVNRNTGDLDVLIEPTIVNGQRVIAALQELKLEIPEIEILEFESPMVLSFGLEPDAIDILNYTPGIEFKQVYENAILADFSELKVPLIDIRDLIKNKESLNRSGEKSYLDLYDIEVLKRIVKRKEQP